MQNDKVIIRTEKTQQRANKRPQDSCFTCSGKQRCHKNHGSYVSFERRYKQNGQYKYYWRAAFTTLTLGGPLRVRKWFHSREDAACWLKGKKYGIQS